MSIERLKFRGQVIENFTWRKTRSKRTPEAEHRAYDIGDWMYSTDLGLDAFFCAVDNGHIDPATVGQWTGLTDKNGTEIYEGDILWYSRDDQEQKGYQGVVKWSTDFGWQVVWGDRIGFVPDCHHVCKVIGNIHEKMEDNAQSESDNHTPE